MKLYRRAVAAILIMLGSIGANAVTMGSASAAASSCGVLNAGESLNVGEALFSCNGQYELVLQDDGNLVLYGPGASVGWSSNILDPEISVLIMQGDGNLVAYRSGRQPSWASTTGGRPGAALAVQDDGNLVIYQDGATPVWVKGAGATYSKCVDLSRVSGYPGDFAFYGEYWDNKLARFQDIAGRSALVSIEGARECDLRGQRFVRVNAALYYDSGTVTAFLQQQQPDGGVSTIAGTEDTTSPSEGFFTPAFSRIKNVAGQRIRGCGRFVFAGNDLTRCGDWIDVPD